MSASASTWGLIGSANSGRPASSAVVPPNGRKPRNVISPSLRVYRKALQAPFNTEGRLPGEGNRPHGHHSPTPTVLQLEPASLQPVLDGPQPVAFRRDSDSLLS